MNGALTAIDQGERSISQGAKYRIYSKVDTSLGFTVEDEMYLEL